MGREAGLVHLWHRLLSGPLLTSSESVKYMGFSKPIALHECSRIFSQIPFPTSFSNSVNQFLEKSRRCILTFNPLQFINMSLCATRKTHCWGDLGTISEARGWVQVSASNHGIYEALGFVFCFLIFEWVKITVPTSQRVKWICAYTTHTYTCMYHMYVYTKCTHVWYVHV